MKTQLTSYLADFAREGKVCTNLHETGIAASSYDTEISFKSIEHAGVLGIFVFIPSSFFTKHLLALALTTALYMLAECNG